MNIRKDVDRLAGQLASVSGINRESVYTFLMDTGRDIGKNPVRLNWTAATGIIFPKGLRDLYSLEIFKPSAEQKPTYCGGSDYETLILARQEAWMD